MTIKLRLVPRAALKARVAPRLGASVAAGSDINVALAGNVYTVSLDRTGLGLANLQPLDADLTALSAGGVSGYHWVGNGVGSTASFQGFVQSGAGAVTRTWSARLKDAVNATDFSTLAEAITYANSVGKAVKLPAGTYPITTLTIPAGMSLIGESPQNTIISTSAASGDVITIGGSYVAIEGIQLAASAARSTGWMINASNIGNATIRNCFLGGVNQPNVLLIGNSTATIRLDRCIVSPTLNAVGLQIGNGAGTAGVELAITDCLFLSDLVNRAFANIILANVGDLTISRTQLIGAATNMYMTPATGQFVVFVKGSQVWMDNASGAGLNINPSGTATVRDITFANGWFGNNNTGVSVTRTNTATVDGLSFVNNTVLNSAFGISADGSGGLSNIRVLGGYVASHASIGLNFNNIDGVSLQGVRVGPYAANNLNALGIKLNGTTDNVYIDGVNALGNTSNYSNVSSGTTIKIHSSPGITATPWTAAEGGTDQSSYAVGDILYASGAAALSKLADVATGNALISGGVGVVPTWGKIGLTTHISGTLGLANGGTNANLSATGGTSQVLRQSSSGAAITVSQLAASDLSNGVTGSGAVVLAAAPTVTGTVTHTFSNGTGSGTITGFSGSATRTASSGGTDTFNGYSFAFTDNGTVNVTATAAFVVTPTYNNASNTSTFNSGLQIAGQVAANLTNFDGIRAGLTTFAGTLTTYNAFHAASPGGTAPTTKRAFLSDSGAGPITQNDTSGVLSAGPVAGMNATAIPAGGTAGQGFLLSSTSNFGVFFGSGAPSLSAAKGSLYLRSDGSGTGDRAYINTNGSTTWTALTTAA